MTKVPVSKAYAKWMDEDAERLNAMAELARKVAVTLPSKEEAEERAYCPTGQGNGVDNSCPPGKGDYDPGGFDVGPDPSGRTSEHILYSPAVKWVQKHESLVVDALNQWKGSPTDIELHLRDELAGKPEPDSGTGKISRARARALLKEVEENSEPAPTLYRGDNKPPEENTSVLLGWTSKRRVAESFARKRGGQVYTLKGANGLNTAKFKRVFGMGEAEWIVLHNKRNESRAFCPTGPGGGVKNDCSPVSVSDPSLKERVPFTPVGDGKNSDFIRVPSVDELTEALTGSNSSKGTKIGSAKDLPAGTPVAVRIDIPAFNYSTKNMGKAIYAVTIHENKGGKSFGSPLAYEPMARLTGPVTFAAKEKEATKVATGESAKFPLATVKGKFDPSRTMPPDIDSWTPVGYDPKKAAYFYDKKTGREVMGGTDALSVGNSVFVRVPKYGYRNAKETYRDAGFWGVEFRADDCGRQDGGKFGPGNKCQEEGDGSTATAPASPSPSTPTSTKMPTAQVGDPANGTAWLSPSGVFHPVPRATPPQFRPQAPRGFMTHDQWASLHGHEGGEDDLIKAGWTRVAQSGRTLYVQTGGKPLTHSQLKSLKDQAMAAGNDEVEHDLGGDKRRTIWSKNDRSVDVEGEPRAFCPTGEGGGVKNDCSPSDGGSSSDSSGSSSTATAEKPQSNLFSKDENTQWSPASGREPFPGASRYSDISVSGGKAVASSLDSMGIKPEDAVSLLGAPERSSVFMRPAPEFGQKFYAFSGTNTPPVFMGFEADVAGIRRGLEGTYVLGSRKNNETGKQDLVLYGNVMDVLPAVSATAERRHAAARAFYKTMVSGIENARKAGVSTVMFSAAGKAADSDRAGSFKGYTIWPRMGFDGPLPKHIVAKLPPDLSHARTLMDLHATREGTKWWAKNGEDIDVELNLADRNSPQNKIFDRFVKHFSRDRRDLPLGEGDGWLSPEDLARLDEMWAEIWDDEDILDDYDGGEQRFVVESRSADCGRDEDGQFASGNSCQIGININDSTQDFTGQILAGSKTTETRITDSLKPYVGKTVGIVSTGKGKATLVGTMKIGKPKFYKTKKEFDADYEKHRISPGSPHYIGKAGKYGYPLTEVKKVKPVKLDSKGIVARVVNRSHGEETIEYELPSEARAYCPTGEGNGIDNSCSSSGPGAGLTNLGGKVETWGSSNETEIWTPDRPMFRGADKIGEIMINRPADVRSIAGDTLQLTMPEIVTASGALIDAIERAGTSRARMTITPAQFGSFNDGIYVSWKVVGRATGDGYVGADSAFRPRPGTVVNAVEASRTISRDSEGKTHLYQDAYFIHPDYQGKGLALESVVRQTSVSGIHSISMGASRWDHQNPNQRMNGYWRWPLYGYTASIPTIIRDSKSGKIPKEYSKARSLLDIYAMPGGKEWWKEEGEDVTLHFDPRPRSQSRLVLLQLQDIVRRKHGSRSIDMTGDEKNLVSFDCDNDPDVEAAWDEIIKKGLKQEAPGRIEELEASAEKFLQERATDGRPPEVRPH